MPDIITGHIFPIVKKLLATTPAMIEVIAHNPAEQVAPVVVDHPVEDAVVVAFGFCHIN